MITDEIKEILLVRHQCIKRLPNLRGAGCASKAPRLRPVPDHLFNRHHHRIGGVAVPAWPCVRKSRFSAPGQIIKIGFLPWISGTEPCTAQTGWGSCARDSDFPGALNPLWIKRADQGQFPDYSLLLFLSSKWLKLLDRRYGTNEPANHHQFDCQ